MFKDNIVRSAESMVYGCLACFTTYLALTTCISFIWQFIAPPHMKGKEVYFDWYAIIFLLIYLFVSIMIGYGIYYISVCRRDYRWIHIGSLLFLLAFLLRVGSVLFADAIGVKMYSDFGIAYREALQMSQYTGFEPSPFANKVHIVDASYWGFYSVISSLLFHILPASTLTMGIVNSLSDAGSTLLLFLIAYKITGKIRVALFTGLIYAFYPTLILYVNMFTGEFLGVFFLLLGFWLWIQGYELLGSHSESTWKLRCIFMLWGSGMSWAISNCFKPVVLVVLIAVVIYVVLSLIKAKILFTGYYFRKVMRYVFSTGLVIMAYCITSLFLVSSYQRYLKVEIRKTTLYANLYIGLNVPSVGQIKPYLREKITEIRDEYPNDVNAQSTALKHLTIETLKANRDKYLYFIRTKVFRSFCDVWWSHWFWGALQTQGLRLGFFIDTTIALFHYTVILLLSSISLWNAVFRRRYLDKYRIFLAIVLSGAIMMLLLIETQGRYKMSLLLPFYVLQAGIGAQYLKICILRLYGYFNRRLSCENFTMLP